MSTQLHPGAICASLDTGALFVVETIDAQLAHVRPVAGGPIELAAVDDLWPLLDGMP